MRRCIRACWGAIVGVVLGLSCGTNVFTCEDDAACVGPQGDGVCQPGNVCSFPDAICESGQRYGEYSGPQSGQCVPEAVEPVATETNETDPGGIDTGGVATGGIDSDDSLTTTVGVKPDTGSGQVVEFTDDAFEGEFGAGEFLRTIWQSDAVTLEAQATEGQFVSRVFDAGSPVQWQALRWRPLGPYGKPLPDGGQMDPPRYAQDRVDMTSNVLLLHFEGGSAADPGAILLNQSGLGLDFVIAGASMSRTDGRLGKGLLDNSMSYAYNDDWGGAFNFGTGDFSWGLWSRSTSDCLGSSSGANQVYLGIDGTGSQRSHLWLGCLRPSASDCGDGPNSGRAGGTYTSDHGDDGGSLCSQTGIIDGSWHHLMVTKSGHDPCTLTLYVDGQAEDIEVVSMSQPISFPAGTQVAIGAFSDGTFPADVTLDEVAVWKRALTGEEVLAMYRRGARHLGLMVRTCDDPSCGDEPPFVGPDGVPGSTFEDDMLGSEQVLSPEVAGPRQYVQYQLQLSQDVAGTVPGGPSVAEVTVEGVSL